MSGAATPGWFQSGISLCSSLHSTVTVSPTASGISVLFQSGISLCSSLHKTEYGRCVVTGISLFQSGISLCSSLHRSVFWQPVQEVVTDGFNQASACVALSTDSGGENCWTRSTSGFQSGISLCSSLHRLATAPDGAKNSGSSVSIRHQPV